MITKFGLKEAREASKFATSDEQKQTVLAMCAMVGLKNVIAKQIVRARAKAIAIIRNNDNKVAKLNSGLAKTKKVQSVQTNKLNEVDDIGQDWLI